LSGYVIEFEYHGTFFSGIQTQTKSSVRTVVGEFENCIKKFTNLENKIVYSGRTDGGVHAVHQVMLIQIELDLQPEKLRKLLNRSLPQDIYIKSVMRASKDFHPRFSAVSREYQFIFTNEDVPVYMRDRVQKVNFDIDLGLCKEFVKKIIGTHDFGSFTNPKLYKNTIRTVYECEVFCKKFPLLYSDKECVTLFYFKICADGFLYRMVRHIVGVLFEVLTGKMSLEELQKMLVEAGYSRPHRLAEAKGLALVKISF